MAFHTIRCPYELRTHCPHLNRRLEKLCSEVMEYVYIKIMIKYLEADNWSRKQTAKMDSCCHNIFLKWKVKGGIKKGNLE